MPGGRIFRLSFLAVLLVLAACGSSVSLISDVNEEQANTIIEVLQQHDIKAAKEKTGSGSFQITVDPQQIGEAIHTLSMAGLPRERLQSIGDIFKKEGLISSPFEERVRYAYALSQSLQDTINQISGVISSRVHIALPEARSVTPQTPSASVLVLYNPQTDANRNGPTIRKMVSNSIPGLTYDRISVAFMPTGPEKDTDAVNSQDDESGLSAPPAHGIHWTILAVILALSAVAALSGIGWKFSNSFRRISSRVISRTH
ncbi:MAG: type III secretion inner membrane ring lipoprotein SctJ [Parvibaculaceae bacterium]|nr:type III secretion inner membrane ring lipoprotein SctJ [Parvibaculaceae bacterium]